jgi:hypothetical protein
MWIVIELFDIEYPMIVTNNEGVPLLFTNRKEAKLQALECQKGKVVKIC